MRFAVCYDEFWCSRVNAVPLGRQERLPVALKYRTFWPRFWAALIDTGIFIPLVLGSHWIFRADTPQSVRGAWFLFSTFSGVAYSIFFHARWGQTIGKRLMGVVLRDVSEAPLSLGQAVVRDFLPLVFAAHGAVSFAPMAFAGKNPFDLQPDVVDTGFLWFVELWTVLEVLTMLTNSRRRALHDLIARSVVVRVSELDPKERAAWRDGAAAERRPRDLKCPSVPHTGSCTSSFRCLRAARVPVEVPTSG